MSRKSVMDPSGVPLDSLIEDVVFRPTDEQRRLKSKFLSRIADNPLVDPASISLDEVRRIVGGAQISKWWPLPGFREWFLNTTEYQEKLEDLFSLALDAARDILISTDPKTQSARTSMIKVVAELAGKMKKPDDGAGKAAALISKFVASMDQAQLAIFLKTNGVSPEQVEASQKVLDIPSQQ